MDTPEKRLRERLRDLHDYYGLSWRQAQAKHYPGVSHTVLRDIAELGKFPTTAKTRNALGLPVETEIIGLSWPGVVWISPDSRILTCHYRECNIDFVANAPNQIYHSKKCGYLERRAQEADNENLP